MRIDRRGHEANNCHVDVIHWGLRLLISLQWCSLDQCVQCQNLSLGCFILRFEHCNVRLYFVKLNLVTKISIFDLEFQVLKLFMIFQLAFLQVSFGIGTCLQIHPVSVYQRCFRWNWSIQLRHHFPLLSLIVCLFV